MKRIAMLAAFALVAGIGAAMADSCGSSSCKDDIIEGLTETTLPQDSCGANTRPEPATIQRADPWWRSRWALEPEPSPTGGRR
jgi:hypothetical protein